MGAACDSNKCCEALQRRHVWKAAEAAGLRLKPPAWPSLRGRPVEPCQRCPPKAGSPLHAGGTMSRQCAPSGGQLRCSLKTLAPTSGWATRCSRCRWACQTALHLLLHFHGKHRPHLCCWQTCMAVAFSDESCSLSLASRTVAGHDFGWRCIATRGACLAAAKCRATCSSSIRQPGARLRTGPAAHQCSTHFFVLS